MAETVTITIEGQDKLSPVLGKAERGLEELKRSAGGLSNALGSVLTGAAAGVAGVLTNLAIQGVGTVVGAVSGAVNTFANFEQAQLKLQAVSGATNEELNQMREMAMQLGESSRFSGSEALNAMIQLAQGGVHVRDILGGATQAALDLAAAGGINLAGAAEIVAKQLAVWGDTGINAAQVATLISSAANASTTDVQELAYGFAAAGSVAKATGMSFEDTAVALAAIVPTASSAQDAGTSLKVALQRLSAPTKEMRQLMDQLGISLFDSEGNFVGIEELAEQLKNALQGLSDEQRAAVLEMLGGADAARALGRLAELGADGVRNLREQMNGLGTASDQAKKMNQGLSFAFDELNAKFETLGLKIGERLAPILKEVVAEIGSIVEAVSNMIGNIPVENIVNTVKEVRSAFDSLKKSVQETLNSIGLKVQVVREDLRPIGEDIKNTLRNALESLKEFANSVIEVWQRVVGFISQAFQQISSWIENIMPKEIKQAAASATSWVSENIVRPVSKYSESVSKRSAEYAMRQAKDLWLSSLAGKKVKSSSEQTANSTAKTAAATRQIALNFDEAKKKAQDLLDSVNPMQTKFGSLIEQLNTIASPSRSAQGLVGSLQSTIDSLRGRIASGLIRERFADVNRLFMTEEELRKEREKNQQDIIRQDRKALLDTVLELATSAWAALQGRTDAAAQFALTHIMALPRMIAEGFDPEGLLSTLELVRQDLIASFSADAVIEAKQAAAAAKMEQSSSRFEVAVQKFEQAVLQTNFWRPQVEISLGDLRLLRQVR